MVCSITSADGVTTETPLKEFIGSNQVVCNLNSSFGDGLTTGSLALKLHDETSLLYDPEFGTSSSLPLELVFVPRLMVSLDV